MCFETLFCYPVIPSVCSSICLSIYHYMSHIYRQIYYKGRHSPGASLPDQVFFLFLDFFHLFNLSICFVFFCRVLRNFITRFVGRLPFFNFFGDHGRLFFHFCSCQSQWLSFFISAPAHLHVTWVALYPALFSSFLHFSSLFPFLHY